MKKVACIQIDCILEFSVDGEGLTQTEAIDKVRKVLNEMSYKEMGEKLQVEPNVRNWHLLDEESEEIYNHYGWDEED